MSFIKDNISKLVLVLLSTTCGLAAGCLIMLLINNGLMRDTIVGLEVSKTSFEALSEKVDETNIELRREISSLNAQIEILRNR